MKKPKPQSTQAPSCTTILHKAFSLFQHHLKFSNLRWKGNDLHFQFRCLDVHGNSCGNQRIEANSKSCLDVQNMELNFDLGLGFFALYISKFLIFI
jgi:hypothetical protein